MPAPPAAVAAQEPEPAASRPLRLDAQTLGRAAAGTEGTVQQMARRSGTALDSPRPGQAEALASAVAKTAVPDCLAPNAGGSLLSMPVIAYMAIRGKCK